MENHRGEMSRETRAIAESLLTIVTAVGGVVVNKIKECVTLQAGGRYDLDQTGYWFFKHGDETIMVLNDDRENYEQDKTAVDLHQGDCYFWFGADVDLTNLGLSLSEYRFNCCVDANYNICFNTPFGDWVISSRSLIGEAVHKVIDWSKCVFTKINEAIWKVYSFFVGDRSYIPSDTRAPQTINYPGLTLVHALIGDTAEEQKHNAISVQLKSGDITIAQNNVDDAGIIKIPDTTWDHIINGIEDPNQSFYNSLYIDVQQVNPAAMLESNTATCSIDNSVIDIANASHQGKIELPSQVFSPITNYNANGKTYTNSIEIDVSNIATRLAPNLVANKNGRWEVVDTNNDPQDLEFVDPDNRNFKTIRLIEKNKTKDEEEEEEEEETPTPVSFGTFEVDVKPVIEFGGVTIDNNFIPFSSFTNNTNSVGVSNGDVVIWIYDDNRLDNNNGRDYYSVNFFINRSGSGHVVTNNDYNKYYYILHTISTAQAWLTDKNNNKLIALRDYPSSDIYENYTYFARSNFNFDFQYNNNS
ncbi:hypothetical protein BCR32DRAFT_248119 [Anaeromyces robustus]|uniref:Uncharacterized protein n=1 Tax=Anaeromyces robustus TaxID=1754192 RepID=A0A1Y1WUL2_9FUNG|nr:hypothetical protein BCR32DRAFT_248119 [Anaeromyces robustus]|eukprot:ORX77203.1 hypothetical protein BCR32DRAFT_248119 [Anaeromyces robustus]